MHNFILIATQAVSLIRAVVAHAPCVHGYVKPAHTWRIFIKRPGLRRAEYREKERSKMVSKESPRFGCTNTVTNFFEKESLFDDVKQQLKKGAKVERTSSPASIMYTGGTIRPVAAGAADKIVEAVGFHDGKVVAAGKKGDVMSKMNTVAGSYTTCELSKGQTLLPGFIEPHVHILSTALMTAGWNDFSPFKDQDLKDYNANILKLLIEAAKPSLPDGFWILGYGVDPSLMPFVVNQGSLNVLQRFDCDTVDKMESTIPVFMMSASGHTAYVNTVALRAVFDLGHTGYDSFAKYKEAVNESGGLQEIEQITPAMKAIPKLQLIECTLKLKDGLDSLFKLATKRGVTMLYDAAISFPQKEILDLYLALYPFRARVGCAPLCNSTKQADELDKYHPITTPLKLFEGSVKLVYDGSNQGLTGYQFEPYRCEPANNYGISNFSIDDLKYMVKTIAAKGWPLMIHGNGNRAICNILDAYQEALGGGSGLAKRNRIEHCSLLDEATLQRMVKIGISPSFLIGHVGYWGYVFKNAIFEEKALTLGVCQSALQHGLRITLHSDNFVSPLGPLRMMEQAITRIMEQDPNQEVLNASEKLTPSQALRVVTYDAAWQCHVDQWVGSLEEGKLADYIILEEDPITRSNPVGMRNIPVLETWVGGAKVN